MQLINIVPTNVEITREVPELRHRGTVGGIPCVATVLPRELGREGREQVVQTPTDDDVVVDGHHHIREDHRKSETCVNEKKNFI